MAVFYQQTPIGGEEIVGGAAGLRTTAAVAAAFVEVLTHVALAAVAHAEGTVDEGLEVDRGGLADGTHLLQGSLAGQDDASEPY